MFFISIPPTRFINLDEIVDIYAAKTTTNETGQVVINTVKIETTGGMVKELNEKDSAYLWATLVEIFKAQQSQQSGIIPASILPQTDY